MYHVIGLLGTSLVNVSLKFQTLIAKIYQNIPIFLLKTKASLIFSTKNFSVFGYYKVVKYLTS